jgi:TRAP-type C4-dicarboxylate transport system substrate-binding protein
MSPPHAPTLRRRAALALGGAALSIPLIARPARAAVTSWVFYTVAQRGTPGAGVWQAMAARVKTATEGALDISVVTAGRIGVDANAITPAITSGALTMGHDSYYAQVLIAGGIPRLPMLVPDLASLRRGSKAMRAYLTPAYDARGAVLLGYTYTPKLRSYARLPVDNFAGMANRRIRSTSPEQAEFIRRLGAAPVTMPTADIPRALAAGEVDVVFTFAATGGTLWRKGLKSGYAAGPHHYDSVIIANKAAFQALAKPLRDVLVRETATAETEYTQTLVAREDEALRRLADDGLELGEQQTDDVSTITARVTGLWDEWTRVRGQETQDLLFAFRRAMEAQ